MFHQIKHIAIIPDGNGRWAQRHGKIRTQGHNQGAKAVLNSIYDLIELNIPHVTYYAFSTENWKRPAKEVDFLMNLLKQHLKNKLDGLHKDKIAISFIGRREGLDKEVIRIINEAEKRNIENPIIHVHVALNYGGRAEVVDCFKRIVKERQTKGLDIADIEEEDIANNLYIPSSQCPDPDFIWRSSGEMRLSNFLLWQTAYSEYVSDDFLWPDYKKDYLEKAIAVFYERRRRFGDV